MLLIFLLKYLLSMVFYIKPSLINIEIDNNNKIIIDNKEHRGGSNKFFTKDDEQSYI